ncbi:MAG: siderophore-interacting protein [Pseudomonadota bacterium]
MDVDTIDVLEHVNEDHAEEVLSIAQVFVQPDAIRAQVLDVTDDRVVLDVETPTGRQTYAHPFTMTGEAEDKVLFLAYQAMVKQRKLPPGTKTRYFRFVERHRLSQNMLRLVFATDRTLPVNEPGYAFLFSLQILRPVPKEDVEYAEMPMAMRLWFRGLLIVMKRLRPETRRKLLSSMYKKSKYYTLRASFSEQAHNGLRYLGWVDVFTHGTSPGSLWAESLTPGDMVKTTAETAEKTDHIHTGRVLLVADETAMPALASVLEEWRNPTAPTLLLISRDDAEQAYIDASLFPAGSSVYRVIGAPDERQETLSGLLPRFEQFEAAWGASENAEAKLIRGFLRTQQSLPPDKNRVRGYWKIEDFKS